MTDITPAIVHIILILIGFGLIVHKDYLCQFFGAMISFYVGYNAYTTYSTIYGGYNVFIMVCVFLMFLGISRGLKTLLGGR